MFKKKKEKDIAGLLIPAGTLIGIGVGFILDQIVAGTLIGIGCGFLGMFIASLILRKK